MTAGPTRWLADEESKPAPQPLLLVQSLVNTVELPEGPDRLADPADARPWLVDNGLLARQGELSEADLDLLRAVREALRTMLVHNAGGPPPNKTALAVLRTVAERGSARADLDDDGEVRLAADGDSLRDRLVDLLLIIRDAQRDGSWALLKACANDECQWAFYDKSRNRSGQWCVMAVCGNRSKARSYRDRKRDD